MMNRVAGIALLFSIVVILGCRPEPVPDPDPDSIELTFEFRDSMPEKVLRSYLSRYIYMAEFCTHPSYQYDGMDSFKEDHERMILNTGAKLISGSVLIWGGESRVVNDRTGFFDYITSTIARVHEKDPEIIFQGGIFEIVTPEVDQIAIPSWVFEAYGLPAEERNFKQTEMLNPDGSFANHWGNGGVPDIRQQEAQMWIYFLARQYIDAGIESIHLGQAMLMSMAEGPEAQYESWTGVVEKIRAYAREDARRGMVLLTAHVNKGMKKGDQLLFDYHGFPLRIVEKKGFPQEGILLIGEEPIYGNSLGGTTPGGWSCKSLPYIVEFDNYGISDRPGEPNAGQFWIWGYDEISWFSQQPEDYRNEFLEYAIDWIEKRDPAGYLSMPGNRVITGPNGTRDRYMANTPSDANGNKGYNQEVIIKTIWEQQ
ncbi:MAG: hypothetical protein ABFS10_05900 [Bacteroidota bacterium]